MIKQELRSLWARNSVSSLVLCGVIAVVGSFFVALTDTPRAFADSINDTDFVTVWKTDNPGSTGSNQISIPINSAYSTSYNYAVDWNDDGIYDNTGVTGSITHTYATPGTYTVRIHGDFPAIYFNDGGDRRKIIDITQWGDIQWQSMERSFDGAANMQMSATDTPDLSQVTNARYMFADTDKFNGSIGNFDVSHIQDMAYMFLNATAFNQPLNSWDTHSLTSLYGTFRGATAFNQPINDWDVSNVTNMYTMFYQAYAFNQPLDKWDTSKVEQMGYAFGEDSAFNQSLANWSVASLRDDTTEPAGYFGAENMFDDTALSTANYDATLLGWSAQNVAIANMQLGANVTSYCQATTARQNLVQNLGWTITDAGQKCDFAASANGETLGPVQPIVTPNGLQFSGVADPGSSVHVEVHSDPVVCDTTADENGQWSCTLSQSVPSGDHTVLVRVTSSGVTTEHGPYAIHVIAGATNAVDGNSPRAPDTGIASVDHGMVWLMLAASCVFVIAGIIAVRF